MEEISIYRSREYDPNVRKLGKIIKLQQSNLKEFILAALKKKKREVIEDLGYIYSKGELPVLLVAHLDTYSNPKVEKLNYALEEDVIYSEGNPIGADDRCGVYAILKILEESNPHVLFTVGEEIGGLGAIRAAGQLEPPEVKYIMELDRQRYYNYAFYRCRNRQFSQYIDWDDERLQLLLEGYTKMIDGGFSFGKPKQKRII